jgi:hypothetical protein
MSPTDPFTDIDILVEPANLPDVLPHCRGPHPIHRLVLDRQYEAHGGVTLHKMTAGFDDILAQIAFSASRHRPCRERPRWCRCTCKAGRCAPKARQLRRRHAGPRRRPPAAEPFQGRFQLLICSKPYRICRRAISAAMRRCPLPDSGAAIARDSQRRALSNRRSGCKQRVASVPHSKLRSPRGFGRQSMRYNWDRAPSSFERHRKALAAAILIAGGVGLMLAALPL